MTLKCFVIDDENLARKGIKEYIQDTEFLEFVGEANNPLIAAQKLKDSRVDILFLDIEMPQMTGLDFLDNFNPDCDVIFTTAFPDFALKGFELEATDYLLKPIPYNRFLKSVMRVYHRKKQTAMLGSPSIFIKTEGKVVKVNLNDILYLQAMQNYVILHTIKGKHIVHTTLKSFYSRLPESDFLKVQKSYIANLNKVEAIEGNTLSIEGQKIPVSRELKKEIRETLIGNRLIGK